MNVKTIIAISSVMMIASIFTGCDDVEDDYRIRYAETEQSPKTTTLYIDETEKSAALAAEEELIKDKINEVFSKGFSLDPEKDYDTYDYEVVYYLETGIRPGNKDDVIRYFKSDEHKVLDTFNIGVNDIDYGIYNIWKADYLESQSSYSFLQIESERGLNDFLISAYVEKYRENMSELPADKITSPWPTSPYYKFADVSKGIDLNTFYKQTDNSFFKPFSEISEMTGIDDYRIATVDISTKDGIDSHMIIKRASVPVYIFKINGTWKVDMLLTMEHYRFTTMGTIEELFAEPISEEDEAETDAEGFVGIPADNS